MSRDTRAAALVRRMHGARAHIPRAHGTKHAAMSKRTASSLSLLTRFAPLAAFALVAGCSGTPAASTAPDAGSDASSSTPTDPTGDTSNPPSGDGNGSTSGGGSSDGTGDT